MSVFNDIFSSTADYMKQKEEQIIEEKNINKWVDCSYCPWCYRPFKKDETERTGCIRCSKSFVSQEIKWKAYLLQY